jgi:hypothetical protein
MNEGDKILLAVVYDKRTGGIVLSHRVVLLEKGQKISKKELLEQTESLATKSKLPLPAQWGSTLFELTREEGRRLLGVVPATQQPQFADIPVQDRNETK